MALDIPMRKVNTGRKSLPFSGPKKLSAINSSVKNVKRVASFMHALKF